MHYYYVYFSNAPIRFCLFIVAATDPAASEPTAAAHRLHFFLYYFLTHNTHGSICIEPVCCNVVYICVSRGGSLLLIFDAIVDYHIYTWATAVM